MIEALRFQQTSPKLVAPPISGGLPKGLVLQLWIRRTGDNTRQPIVELAGDSSRLVLGTGARPDVLSLALIANGTTTEITAPGALPIARWVQARAVVRMDGTATLEVLGMKLAEGKLPVLSSEPRTLKIGGLIGELAQLQVWKHHAPNLLSYDPPKNLDAGNLWAYYSLAKLGWDATNKQSIVEDAGPHEHHAVLQGSANAPVRVTHDEPLDRGQAAHLRFVSNDKAPKIGPLLGLKGRLTLEAWVCPVGNSPMPVIQLQGTERRLALVAGGTNGEVALLSIDNSAKVTVLARATGLAKPNAWSHVAVTLEVVEVRLGVLGAKIPQVNVGLFQNGQRRKSESFKVGLESESIGLMALLEQALIPDVSLGGLAPGYPFFRGGMAEVRIWAGADQQRVETLWLARARGDEDELIGCWRLDTDPAKPLVDISKSRGFTQAFKGVSLGSEQCPPLAATSGGLAFPVQARGKLLREQLIKPSSGSRQPTNKINLQVTNTTTGQTTNLGADTGQRCVFDATIEVSTRSGNSPLGRTLEVRVDEPMTALQVVDGKIVQTPWPANQPQSISLPTSGRVRLRFAASQLACPTIRVRVSGTPGGVWTIVRPDETAQGRLRSVTAQSLKSPGDGRRSPLPAGTSDADVQALTDALGKLRGQLVQGPSTSTARPSSKIFGSVGDLFEDVVDEGTDLAGDVWDGAVGVYQDASSGAQDTLAGATTVAKSAGQLIVRGTAELEALASKCAKQSAWVGEQALATAIKSADTLAFVAVQSGRWVEAIGTSIVDGTEVAWRVVVSGVDAALTAVTELIERIGAQIMEWVEYLAWLFMWDDFLEESDEMQKHIEAAMSGIGGQIAGLDGIKNQLGDALRESVEDAIGKRSLADVFGIDVDEVSPAFEQLDYVLEKFQDLLESADLNWGKSSGGEGSPGIEFSAAATTQASEIERLQPFGDPSDVVSLLSTPLSELLASNDKLANGSSSLIDAIFDPITETSSELLELLDDAMFSRLSVPYLTEILEETILCGRKLTMARIVALTAAIPAVLTKKSSGSSSRSNLQLTLRPSDEPSKAELERRKAEEQTRWVLWAVMSCGIINTVVLIAKSVAERRATKPTKFISMCQLISGGFGILRGIFLLGRVPAFTPSTQRYAAINATVELTAGLCSAFFGARGLEDVGKLDTPKDLTKFEVAAQMIFGATIITSSGIAVGTGDLGDKRTKTAFGFRCSSWVLSLLVRLFEKLDDKDTTGRLKIVTMGLAGVQVVVEVSEAIYGNVGDAQPDQSE